MTDNTTMLERAAKGMFDANEAQFEWRREWGSDLLVQDRYLGLARAALQAIREPSEDIEAEAIKGVSWDYPPPRESWRNMIDAILSEGPTNG